MSMTNELLKILIPSANLKNIKLGEEDSICIQFANYLRQKTLEEDFPYIWFHVPNQIGMYRPVFGLKQGWMGRIPGVPDFCFMGKESFFIEFKSKKGKQSESQKTFEKWCDKKGIPVHICRSFEEGKEIIDE